MPFPKATQSIEERMKEKKRQKERASERAMMSNTMRGRMNQQRDCIISGNRFFFCAALWRQIKEEEEEEKEEKEYTFYGMRP